MKRVIKLLWFAGRINRTEYWISMVVIWPFIFLADDGIYPLWVLFPLFYLYLAQSAKRCQDRGFHGIRALSPVNFVFNFSDKSQPGINEFGPEPNGIYLAD